MNSEASKSILNSVMSRAKFDEITEEISEVIHKTRNTNTTNIMKHIREYLSSLDWRSTIKITPSNIIVIFDCIEGYELVISLYIRNYRTCKRNRMYNKIVRRVG